MKIMPNKISFDDRDIVENDLKFSHYIFLARISLLESLFTLKVSNNFTKSG